MRKIAAIFLLGILLFNWLGYRWVIAYWQQRAKNVLEARLDVNDYDESQLISIKVPVTHLAYYNTSSAFERVNGSVEIDGVQYKYVKRRLCNDTLELLCLPDQGAMKLQACANDMFRLTTGLATNVEKHSSARNIPAKSFIVDPYVLTPGFISRAPFLAIATSFGELSFSIPCFTAGADEHPPDGRA